MIKRLVLPAVILGLAGCSLTGSKTSRARNYDWSALDASLPDGSSMTPAHNLAHHEYPFDNSGKYIPAWAAEGEKRHGRITYPGSHPAGNHGSSARKIGYQHHKIVSGDTLYGLARRYGTSVNAIKRANKMTSDLIIKGRTLKIP